MESLLPVSAADEISNRGLGLRHKSSGLLTLVVHSRPLRMWEASAGDQVLKMLRNLVGMSPPVIDKQALLSSANLTDDAFLRNLELGVLFTRPEQIM